MRGQMARKWVMAAGVMLALAAGAKAQQEKRPTAREVVEAIKAHVGMPFGEKTVDTFKAGNPDTPVTGVALTMMATMDALQRASAQGLNLIITHEPTYYSHMDVPEGMEESDPVWAEKRAFIEKHGLVIWRFHDYWHRMTPDGIAKGTMKALGWEKYQNPQNQYLFAIPEMTLADLAKYVATKLDTPALRVVGKPEMKVTQVGLSPGFAGFVRETHALEMENVQVLLVGETREWETVEYVDDAVAQGRKKGLIILGHIPSEQSGMKECAEWMKTFVSGVKIEYLPAAQPFWTVPGKYKTY